MEQQLTITIEEHEGMDGVVILQCDGRWFQFADMMVETGPWFKIPSRFGPTFIECDSIGQALKIVTGIIRGA